MSLLWAKYLMLFIFGLVWVCSLSLIGSIFSLIATSIAGGRSMELIIFITSVENGTLHTLDFDNGTSTVIYNLSAVFSFRNTDDDDTHRVNWVAAAPWYGGQKLGADTILPSLKVGAWEKVMVPLEVQGRQVVVDAELAAVVGRTYAEDAGRGYYIIEVKLDMKGDDKRCDSCTLYFPAPAAPRGVINLFDGEECTTRCKSKR